MRQEVIFAAEIMLVPVLWDFPTSGPLSLTFLRDSGVKGIPADSLLQMFPYRDYKSVPIALSVFPLAVANSTPGALAAQERLCMC